VWSVGLRLCLSRFYLLCYSCYCVAVLHVVLVLFLYVRYVQLLPHCVRSVFLSRRFFVSLVLSLF
jgi:hypothetical protein